VIAAIWILGSIAGYLYSQQQNIPIALALAVLPAILVELSLYAATGFAPLRDGLRALRPAVAVGLLAFSASLPYAMYTLATGNFHPLHWAAILGLAAAASGWYAVLPRNRIADLGFLALIAAVALSPTFQFLYPRPAPRLRLEFLGQLMFIRITILSVLVFRHAEGIDFGFWPRKRDWRIGVAQYLWFVPLGFGLGLLTGFLQPVPSRFGPAETIAIAAATFFGFLWVVALCEEFWFRGLLQQWLGRWLSSDKAGLLLTAVLFGLVHLPFRGFPNWSFAALAAIAGLFYGRAYQQAKGIRAPMVTHALVVTTWRIFFF
jgi:membrane protease YdiL (CAAX protease family)